MTDKLPDIFYAEFNKESAEYWKKKTEEMEAQLAEAKEVIAAILVLDIDQAKEWAEDYLKKHPIK